MSECDKLAAAIEGLVVARADLEKVVGYNTKLQEEHEAATKHYNKIIDKLLSELHDLRLENSGQAALLERKRPEPSRLEIAAMFKAAWFANSDYDSQDACDDGWWIEQADKLIEANKK